MRGGMLVLFLLLGVLVAGCLDPSRSQGTDDGGTTNPWQAGLDDFYPTPDGVRERSDAERRSDTRSPGDPTFAALDQATLAFMQTYDVPSGQVAIMHDGRLLYAQGYGVADDAGTPATVDTLFRVASVTKPMTAALVDLQVQQGLYNLTDPVFCVPPEPAAGCRLPIVPHPAHPVQDPRIAEVQVQHLLDHTGGWGRSMDWVYRAPAMHDISDAFGVDPPPHPWRVAQYVMGENLTHDPGTTRWYCNVCYILAGLVAEAATGAELGALYDAYLFRPLGVDGDIELGHTLPEARNPRETAYACDGDGPSVYDRNQTVCDPDGNYAMEITSSAGGLIATAAAVAAVYEAYPEHLRSQGFRVEGQDAYGPLYDWTGHGGALDGVAARAGQVDDRPDLVGRVHYAVMFSSSDPIDCYDGNLGPVGYVNLGCPMSWYEQTLVDFAVAYAAGTDP